MRSKEQYNTLNILLADDDTDDCIFFKESLNKIPIPTHLVAVHDGEQLMQLLTQDSYKLPDVLFLDLNMPRKNGFECLSEIKLSKKLNQLPVIMFSTSIDQEVVNLLYKNGAQYFIRKPPGISQFEKIIQKTLTFIIQGNNSQPTKANFIITV